MLELLSILSFNPLWSFSKDHLCQIKYTKKIVDILTKIYIVHHVRNDSEALETRDTREYNGSGEIVRIVVAICRLNCRSC